MTISIDKIDKIQNILKTLITELDDLKKTLSSDTENTKLSRKNLIDSDFEITHHIKDIVKSYDKK